MQPLSRSSDLVIDGYRLLQNLTLSELTSNVRKE